MSLSLVHTVSSLHIWIMAPSLRNCHVRGENKCQTLSDKFVSFLSLLFLCPCSVVNLNSVYVCRGMCEFTCKCTCTRRGQGSVLAVVPQKSSTVVSWVRVSFV